jgi:iron complex outermembrane receptor protein
VPAVAAEPNPSTPPGPPPAAPLHLETVTVTGSFLDHFGAEQTLPVTVWSAERIGLPGVATPAEVFASLPQAGRIPISESQASGADARGDIATASLRGLGSGNTLVLLNGRRLAPHPISMPEGTLGVPSMATNVNTLPLASIGRIEVLRDGASALYGSDATAGVINAILRRDYPGWESGVRWLATEHGGGSEIRATLAGRVDAPSGRRSVVFSYEQFRRDPIRATQRDFARSADFRPLAPAPWDGSTSDTRVDLRSDRGFYGRFQRGKVNPDGTVTGARPAGVTSAQVANNGTFHLVPTATGSATRTWQAAEPGRDAASPAAGYFLNVNEFRLLLPTTRRHNLHVALEQRLPGPLTAFTELTHYHADSRNRREPSRIDATADNNVTVAADNPYNPFGSRFYSPTGAPNPDGTPRLVGTPSAVILSRLSLPEFGTRDIDVRSENARVVAGLRGAFGDTWQWESALLHAAANTTDRESNAIKESQLRDALDGRTPDTALNPFGTTFAIVGGALIASGESFTNPASLVNPLRGVFYRKGRTSLSTWDLRARGRVGTLPAGPVTVAAGGEFRRETYRDVRDAESGRLTAADVQRLGLRASLAGDNNYLQVSPSDNTDARRSVQAAFSEVVVPLASAPHRPFFRAAELTAALRFERDSEFDRTVKPKAGVSARVLPGVLVRASVNDSFRAPNLAALFSGAAQRSITGVNDAYRATATGSSDDGPSARRVSLRTGNGALAPEKARTITAGIVFEPPGVKGLTLAVDAWRIRQTDALTRLDAADLLARDTALLLAANAAAQAVPISQVDLSTAGSPNILRNPVTQDDRDLFAAYNAGRPRSEQRAAVGTIRAIAETYMNAARRELAGIDVTVNWRAITAQFGTVDLTLEAAYLAQFDEQLATTTPSVDLAWRDGNTRWKSSFALSWKKGGWAAGVFTTYTGRTQDSFIRTTPGSTAPGVSPEGFLIVGESWLTNVSLTRHFADRGFLRNSSVRLGVNNVFDAEPPFGLGASSDSDGYLRGFGDPRGRALSVELTKRF